MKPKPSGYVPTWEDNPEKFKSRMKRRAVQAAENRIQSQEPCSDTGPALDVEKRVPSLSSTPSFHSTNPITWSSGIDPSSTE